ncbi:hypothetical protein [Priestia abyssalis]|uniref:hypothetical protein n=1 Tax=Priestia abyssalis TaxID=1221450 RepID=UPI0014727928|nr:hypothetical protein [Priestia abyssalis]
MNALSWKDIMLFQMVVADIGQERFVEKCNIPIQNDISEEHDDEKKKFLSFDHGVGVNIVSVNRWL